MKSKEFSFFPKGRVNNRGEKVMSNHPSTSVTLVDTYNYIIGDKAREATEQLRAIENHMDRQVFKLMNFEYVTFAGVFTYRNSRSLVSPSGLIVLDIDGLETADDVLRVRSILINDRRLDCQLVFTSPGGLGVKAVVEYRNCAGTTHREQFQWLTRYLIFEYGITIDKSGSDITRPCYLPYDAECYINPTLLNSNNYEK